MKEAKIKKTTTKAKGIKPLAHGVGRRKSSVARVWLRRGSGKMIVNGKAYTDYFDTAIARMDAEKPFKVCPIGANYDVEANVQGGGPFSQAGAVRLGISRALVSIDDAVRPVLRQHGLLTVDRS